MYAAHRARKLRHLQAKKISFLVCLIASQAVVRQQTLNARLANVLHFRTTTIPDVACNAMKVPLLHVWQS